MWLRCKVFGQVQFAVGSSQLAYSQAGARVDTQFETLNWEWCDQHNVLYNVCGWWSLAAISAFADRDMEIEGQVRTKSSTELRNSLNIVPVPRSPTNEPSRTNKCERSRLKRRHLNLIQHVHWELLCIEHIRPQKHNCMVCFGLLQIVGSPQAPHLLQ